MSPLVTFPAAEAVELAGELFVPPGEKPTAGWPAVVVTGSWTTVRGQMADRYAAALAERGYAALSFDFAGFGASEGSPRDVEDPVGKTRDIHRAFDFLAAHEEIDGGRLASLAICASAGYSALNAIDDPRVKALALVAPWLHDGALVREMYGGDEGVADRMLAGRRARLAAALGGEIAYVPAQSATDPGAAMPMAMDFYENPDRGAIPEWANRFATMAWPEWLSFDAIALALRVEAPTLLVHSEDAAIPDGARRFHERLAGPKAIEWRDGTQFDFYDGPDHVRDAVARAAEHFERYVR